MLNGFELSREDYVQWQRRLHERGWGAMSWPVEFGGIGWNAVQQYIFEEESAIAGAPRLIPFGIKMVAPVLMAFGSDAQQRRFLPPISSGETWWCQGYSEPGAGSDLASLRTRAVRDGDHYVVNGQKTWNTLGHFADWIFCLVRTDPEAKQQSGITFLLIDMKSPGVSVRPIELLDGAHEVNEVWFEDVRVPIENRIGEENRGWTYAKFLLATSAPILRGSASPSANSLASSAWPPRNAKMAGRCSMIRCLRHVSPASRSNLPRSRSPTCGCYPRSAARAHRAPRRRF